MNSLQSRSRQTIKTIKHDMFFKDHSRGLQLTVKAQIKQNCLRGHTIGISSQKQKSISEARLSNVFPTPDSHT